MIKSNFKIIICLLCLLLAQSVFASEDFSKLAVAYYSDNNIEKTIECLNNIPDGEKTAQDLLLLGNALDEIGDKDKALILYTKALKLEHNYYKAYYNLANIYAEKKAYYNAIHYYKLALKYNKDNAFINYNLGCSYLKIGKIKSANSEFINSIRKQNNIPEFYYNLAYTYKKLGKNNLAESALENYNSSRNLNPVVKLNDF